jgi:putative spermidine/putrescine transport system ATP-binding protein
MRALQLVELRKRFGDVVAVDGISLDVEPGEFVSLLGPSGCGKTTTLRMIAGLEEPDQGRILLGDVDITYTPPERRNVGLMFQDYALFPHMTVGQNVAFGLEMRKMTSELISTKVGQALDMVQLGGLANRYPRQLSGGQQQRVALARALVVEPQLLLLDEPLSNLDAKLRQEMRVELKLIQSNIGITTVYVTHDQEEALTLSDRLVVMHVGRIVQMGSPFEIYERPQDSFVASFLGQENFFRGRIISVNERTIQVHTDAGLTLHATAAGGLRADDPVLLVIKKERIRVAPSDGETEPSANAFPAEVEFVTYLGTTVQYLCSVGGHEVVVSVQNTAGMPTFRRGEAVRLSWDAHDCISIAAT